jgi:hypothetical protein
LEATGCQDDSCADPETAVGRESGGTEGVAESDFPIILLDIVITVDFE